jgi:hypothetical protein
MNSNGDDEWEYEYDETETEDFYIPIDLSNVPSAQVPVNAERKQGHPTLLKSRLRALNAARGQLPDITAEETSTSTQDKDTATMGEVQITGLHTANPLVMYNGQLLSCHWASTIGTDMFFTRPHAEGDDLEQPLRSLPSVDLLSLGTAKLVAKVGRLRPRDDVYEGEEETQPAGVAVEDAGNNQDVAVASFSTAPSNLPRASTNLPTTSTSFIARLNEVKVRRGETTRLAVTQTPDGSRLVSKPVNEPAQLGEDGSRQAAGDVPMGGT